MNIPRDKLLHAGVGLLCSLLGIACALLAEHLGLAPIQALPLAALLPAVAAGATKQYCDWQDNRLLADIGEQPLHRVQFANFAASAAPGVLLAVAAQVLLAP